MGTVLWILGIGVVLGVVYALINKENPLSGALAGGFVAGNCLLQLLIPVFFLLIGLWLFRAIFL